MTKDTDINQEAGADESSDKKKTVADKLKTMGVMPSGIEEEPVKERKSSHMLITVFFGLALVGVVAAAYMYNSGALNDLVASNSSSDDEAATANYRNNANGEYIPTATMANNQSYVQSAKNMNAQQNDWAAKQRADFDQRRAEYDKRMASAYADDRSSPEAPQWVKERQAEMEKYYKEMEQFRKDMEEQQKQWTNQQSNMPYNAASQPGYMRHPQMANGYANPQQPPQAAIAQANRQNMNRAPAQYYYPPRPYYYNQAPYNGYTNRPYPYGWRGYR